MTFMIVQATQGQNQEVFLGRHYVIFFFFPGGTVFFQIKGGFLLSSLKKKKLGSIATQHHQIPPVGPLPKSPFIEIDLLPTRRTNKFG